MTFGTDIERHTARTVHPMATILTIALELTLPALLLLLWRSAERADEEISALTQSRFPQAASSSGSDMPKPLP
jgi:cell division protein FtsX